MNFAARCALGCLSLLPPAAVPGAAPPLHPGDWPHVPPALAADARLEARITTLLAHMTPAQKVGQLIQANIGSVSPDDLQHVPLGSVLNGADFAPHDHKLAPAGEWLALADRFYDASVAGRGPDAVPVMWGTDAVHGDNNIPGATIFPHNIGLGAAHDPALVRRIGEVTAIEVRASGLDWVFAPTVAVARDARWGRTYESYSEDPQLVREYAAAMVRGLQGDPGTAAFLDAAHVIATPKHFLGDGGTGGRDQGDNTASEPRLRELDAGGYVAALAAGAQTVMVSYSSWQGQKMHGNRALLTRVLKERMGFDGLLIGDWDGHAQLPGCSSEQCAAAIEAGVDVLMAPVKWRELYAATLSQVESGEIATARLDDAVRRILRVKLRAHLFTEGRPSSRRLAGHFELLGSPAHRALAREAVRESLVLLKNRNQLLPLSVHAHVLVAGDGADSIAMQCGGWTIDWQGTQPNSSFPHAQSLYAGIRQAVEAAGGSAYLSPAGEFDRRPDVAIVVFGEHPYAESRGDVPTLEFAPGDTHELDLMRRLHAAGVPVVAVFLSGRPMFVGPELDAADSFVAAWLPGTEGGGVADVLFRAPDGSVRHDFHGRLSFSWPRSPQPPAVDGAAGEAPLHPAGFGLTYRGTSGGR
jgi:beta-glucosidase